MTSSGRRNGLLAAGVGTFLLFAIGGLPARLAVGWLAPAGLRPVAVSGTVWSGALQSAQLGRVQLRDTRWSLSPWALLIGRLRADIEGQLGDGSISGTVAISVSGTLACRDCRYQGPLASLRPVVPALRNLDGNLDMAVATLDYANGWPTRVDGSVKVSGVPLRAPGEPAGRNDTTAAFEASVAADPVPPDGLVEATVKDAGGPVELNGRISATPPGNFEFNATARARPGAPPGIANALAVMGPRRPDGSTEMTVAGTF